MTQEADEANEAKPGRPSRKERRLEIVATLLLSIAAVATAWSGYQAALWDGIQSSDYTQAGAARTKAAQGRLAANQERLVDLNLFDGYVNAQQAGEPALADRYRARFRDEFIPAFEAWMALRPDTNPSAPRSPLLMSQYLPPGEVEGDALDHQADQKFESGEKANSTSDTYVATTLFFASVLFFAAISERFEYFAVRIVLLCLAGFSLVVGLAVAFSQPVTWG